jgi:hypothetical protein
MVLMSLEERDELEAEARALEVSAGEVECHRKVAAILASAYKGYTAFQRRQGEPLR